MRVKMMIRSVGRLTAVLAAVGALVYASQTRAALIAQFTFDDGDYSRTGDGMDPGAGGTPYSMTLLDVSGNNNHATNDSTQLSQKPIPPAGPQVYGAAIDPGEPGKFGESHKFWRDPSAFNRIAANTAYTIAPGVVPTGSAARTFSLWFRQRAHITQDKLFGYGTGSAGQAFDISLEGGGLRTRHFAGNITWGSGYEFYEEDPDGTSNVGADAGWHHVAVRVTPDTGTYADVDVFLDGAQLAISAQAGAGTGQTLNTVEGNNPATGYPTHGFGIGSSSEYANLSSQNNIDGWLDEFRIYDTALSNHEIRLLAGIPEPASVLLMVIGLVGSLMFVKRRRS